MIKVKIIYDECYEDLECKINEFLEGVKEGNFIDVKYSIVSCELSAMVIYEQEENTDGKTK